MTTNSVSKERAEGHYWARWGTSANWDVMFWRGGHFWDQQDCGYLPDNFGEIGHQIFPPTSSGGVTSGEVVTDEMVEVAAKFIASELFRSSWEGLVSEGRITDGGFKPIIYSMDGGMQLQGRQDDLRDLARALLTAALAGSNGE